MFSLIPHDRNSRLARQRPSGARPLVMLAAALLCLAASSRCTAADDPAPAAAEETKALFRWKFKPGESLDWQMNQTMEMAMILGNMPVTTNMDYDFGMTWAISEVDAEGRAKCTMRIDQIRMRMKIAEQELIFDTNNKEAQVEGPLAAAAEIFNALAGLQYNVSMTPRGEVTEVDFNEESREKLKKLQNNPAMGQLAQMFSPEGMKQMIGQTSSLFPEEEVAVGQTWERTQEVKNPILGAQKMTAKMKYEGIEEIDGRPLDKISVDMQTNLGEMKLPGVDKFDLTNQDNKQTVYFDRAAGRLVTADTTSHMTMKITAMGQTLEQQIDAKALVTCTAKDAGTEPSKPAEPKAEPSPGESTPDK